MNQLYARVFTQILDSSLAEDWQTRHVFEDLLKLANEGVVDMTRQAIARRTNVPPEIIDRAITTLESPDAASRDASEDGRRLVRLDEHRDWGWRIVNWDKYEAIKSAQDQREKTRERMKRLRERRAGSVSPTPPSPEAKPEAEAEAPSQKRHVASHSVTQRHTQRSAEASPPSKASLSDAEWLEELKTEAAFQGIDVQREYRKMLVWCRANHKQPTRRRFVGWLNRCDRPLSATGITPDHTKGF